MIPRATATGARGSRERYERALRVPRTRGGRSLWLMLGRWWTRRDRRRALAQRAVERAAGSDGGEGGEHWAGQGRELWKKMGERKRVGEGQAQAQAGREELLLLRALAQEGRPGMSAGRRVPLLVLARLLQPQPSSPAPCSLLQPDPRHLAASARTPLLRLDSLPQAPWAGPWA